MNELKAEIPDDPVYSKNVLEMFTVANEYCLFMEKATDYPKGDFLGYLQKICPLIYIKAALLPDVNPTDEGGLEHFVTEEQWEELFNVIHLKLEEDDLYYFIDHHEKTHQEAVKASLAENLTDIYQDLKDFLLLYAKPLKISRENAVYDCKRLFETRFGYRLVNAHSAIHYLLFTEGEKGELSDFFESL
jgi:hypothetical protein